MAICDMYCVFTFIDLGSYGSNNDNSIFWNSSMGSFFNGKMDLPSLYVKYK